MTDPAADFLAAAGKRVVPELTGPAVGKHVRHRTMFTEAEGVVFAETSTELKIRTSWLATKWVPRVFTEEVRRG